MKKVQKLTKYSDKSLESAYYFCENRIRNYGDDPLMEREKFYELVRLTQTELFERCKEIFHSSFKTRKGGKEACNPLRDGIAAFRGKTVNEGISQLVWDLAAIIREFGKTHTFLIFRFGRKLICFLLQGLKSNRIKE